MYTENYYWGMNLIWWILWIILFVWIFAVPYDIPFQRNKKQSAFDILKRRYAAGEINAEEYKNIKNNLNKEKH